MGGGFTYSAYLVMKFPTSLVSVLLTATSLLSVQFCNCFFPLVSVIFCLKYVVYSK